jgi:hypothetical protein
MKYVAVLLAMLSLLLVQPIAHAQEGDLSYLEATLDKGETLYGGTLQKLSADGLSFTLNVKMTLQSGGKRNDLAIPRSRVVTIKADTPLRTADTSALRATKADLFTGATVYAAGKPKGELGEMNARAVFVAVGTAEPLPGDLLGTSASEPDKWEFSKSNRTAADSTFKREDNTFKITVVGETNVDWHVQLAQFRTPTPGQKYTVRFRAKADARRFINVGSDVMYKQPFTDLGLLEPIAVSPRWRQYQFTFTGRPGEEGKNRLPLFSFGQRAGTVWLADITFAPGEFPLPPALARQSPPPGTNLVEEASEPGTWLMFQQEGARGKLTKEQQALKMTITSASGVFWHLQLMHPGLDLEEGRTYTVRFLAKADTPRKMVVAGQLNNKDFHNIGLEETVALGTNWQQYNLKFTATKTEPGHSRVPAFCFGEKEGVVWISNIAVEAGPLLPVAPKKD